MAAGRSNGSRIDRGQGGFTLVEMLVAMALLVVVGSAVLTMFDVGQKQGPAIQETALAVSKARALMERMTRELRQTYDVHATGTSDLNFYTYLRTSPTSAAEARHVLYECDASEAGANACTRKETGPNAAFPDTGVKMIDGIVNDDIFTYVPDSINPEFVEIKFVIEAEGQDRTVTIEDGVNLRNATNFDD